MVGGQRAPYRIHRYDGQLHDLHHELDAVSPGAGRDTGWMRVGTSTP
jgi:hypothetical protein